MTKKSRKRKRINVSVVLAVIGAVGFIAALSVFFIGSFKNTEREHAVYSAMEEPTLPVIYADIGGIYANVMYGYMQDMGNKAASDSITPLPEDRKLGLRIKIYDNVVTELSYEVRSLNLEHYIEKTVVDVPAKSGDGDIYTELPIQNMIEKDIPYLLRIKLTMGEKTVNYYTRIIWSDNNSVFDMLKTASDFNEKTFSYETARDLTVYLESSDSADNSSLDTVGIDSSFSQITWGDSGMQLKGEPELTVKEYDGMMGAVEIRYLTESPGNDGDNPDLYENTDEFTMKAGNDRVYMMNYERHTCQVFEGSKHLFAGNRIKLGIISKDKIQTAKSENGRFIVFKTDNELWSFDQKEKKAVNIFSFRSETDRIRASHDDYDIKILSADDSGNVDFVVYGYMNRGRHEGYNGITYCRYNSQDQSNEEIFFIPIVNNYENIKLELDELCAMSNSGVIYIKQDDSVYAIDGISQELMTVATGLGEHRFASSYDQTKIAWLDGDTDGENSIKLMDIESGNTNTISAENGKVLNVIGFYNNDLIYGERNVGDNRIINGRIQGRPISDLHIVDPQLNSVMDYSKEGLYFEDIRIDGDRIRLAQYKKGEGSNEYSFVSRDTIVSSEEEADLYTNYISSSDTDTKKRIYYVDLDENIKTTRSLKVTAPQNISYEKSGNIELQSNKKSSSINYYAYANGNLTGKYSSLKEAMEACYDEIGWVYDDNCVVLYSRADRNSSHTIKDPFSAAAPLVAAVENGDILNDKITDGAYILMDAQGIELNKLMYYIGKDAPVMARLGDGSYCLLYAYDRTSIGVFYPAENDELSSKQSMSIEEAAQYFAKYNSDFTCFIKYNGK